ncbi:biotin/lipoyl-containing protein, partial [Salmonella enterica]|uniref:biotin/lipoyl-containing protein n=1 Tax=Salmonella enterica TaxID=28901 RepID=UPI0016043DA4
AYEMMVQSRGLGDVYKRQGNIWKVIATEGQTVAEGDVLLILEAMKMETEIRAAQAGTVRGIAVKSGDAVSVGDTLMTLA